MCDQLLNFSFRHTALGASLKTNKTGIIMKLLSYGLDLRMEPRLAFSLRGYAVDVMRASLWMKEDRNAQDFLKLASSMELTLKEWGHLYPLLKRLEEAFQTIDITGLTIYNRSLGMLEADIVFFAPVPNPPSLRYFNVFNPEKSAAFIFGNTQTLLGHRQTQPFSGLLAQAEIAAILGYGDSGLDVAGYSIVNNWFDPQQQGNDGLSLGLATSMGPYFVPAEELEPRKLGKGFSLDLQISVNEKPVAEGHFKEMNLSFAEMLMEAQKTNLQKADVICSGSPLKPDSSFQLKNGDCINIEIQALGVLSNPIGNSNS